MQAECGESAKSNEKVIGSGGGLGDELKEGKGADLAKTRSRRPVIRGTRSSAGWDSSGQYTFVERGTEKNYVPFLNKTKGVI